MYVNEISDNIIEPHSYKSRGSSVSLTGCRLDERDSIPRRGRIFIFSTASRPALRSTQPPVGRAPGVLSSGIKQPERETVQSPPSGAKIKNV
jgi:hypothetical protein